LSLNRVPARIDMMRIGWFTTARGPGSLSLFTRMLEKVDSGIFDAQISFVFINREVKGNDFRAKLIKMAKDRNIPVVIFPSDSFRQDLKVKDLDAWRDAYGEELRSRLGDYDIDFGVLAGYMLILDPETCRRYSLINLHPALPDTYTGTWEEIVGHVVDNNDERYGSMVHLCTPDLDRGQTLAYDSFPVDDLLGSGRSREELVRSIRGREAQREVHLLMETIRMILKGFIVLKDGAGWNKDGTILTVPLCLSSMIDHEMTD
jgi:phosphoribosylglycinamide formyltransferase 1